MFVIVLTYVKPMAMVERYLSEHAAFLDAQYAAGTFVASGRRVPRTGGVILAAGIERAMLEDILERDPFKREGIALFEIIEFTPTKMRAGFEAFVE